MATPRGKIVLMGSGELTATMVEVHKKLLADLPAPARAVFLDTPAGFQLNVDQISANAVEYFRSRIQHPLNTASFKSATSTPQFEAQQALQQLKQADYILIGPGSPTYAVGQWQQTSIPEILTDRVNAGGCLVAASAAALTVGRFTLPVYEIYKVGSDLYWMDGMDLLQQFGMNLVVIPHWNNAEGGNHDTRFCFVGSPRFQKLEALLPDDVMVFGLDEHTACEIDFNTGQATIKGIGRAVLRHRGKERIFEKGDCVPLQVLQGQDNTQAWQKVIAAETMVQTSSSAEGDSFWNRIHSLEGAFNAGLEKHDPKSATNALLEFDRIIWQAQQALESEAVISQARDTLRELIVALGTHLATLPTSRQACLEPLVQALLMLRSSFRDAKQFQAADAIRDCLIQAGIAVEDTRDGVRWHLASDSTLTS
ncbi:MAG: hypothetical protein QNI92_17835 [Desulfobacterales bacterium]|nr:hypothetical protein [Desulfobacterales bacterium]